MNQTTEVSRKKRMSSQNASLFGISSGREQDIKQIKQEAKKIQILGMSSVLNFSQNTAGSHQVSSLLPAAAPRRKFMVSRK